MDLRCNANGPLVPRLAPNYGRAQMQPELQQSLEKVALLEIVNIAEVEHLEIWIT